MTRMNALWNCKNPNQGGATRVLCVCSAGLLRSPTIAVLLAQRGYNTRAAGMYDYSLIEVDEVLLDWADVVLFADQEHYNICLTYFPKQMVDMPFKILNIPDQYPYMDEKLQEIINTKLDEEGY